MDVFHIIKPLRNLAQFKMTGRLHLAEAKEWNTRVLQVTALAEVYGKACLAPISAITCLCSWAIKLNQIKKETIKH